MDSFSFSVSFIISHFSVAFLANATFSKLHTNAFAFILLYFLLRFCQFYDPLTHTHLHTCHHTITLKENRGNGNKF